MVPFHEEVLSSCCALCINWIELLDSSAAHQGEWDEDLRFLKQELVGGCW
jgi:hypothetical protein